MSDTVLTREVGIRKHLRILHVSQSSNRYCKSSMITNRSEVAAIHRSFTKDIEKEVGLGCRCESLESERQGVGKTEDDDRVRRLS